MLKVANKLVFDNVHIVDLDLVLDFELLLNVVSEDFRQVEYALVFNVISILVV